MSDPSVAIRLNTTNYANLSALNIVDCHYTGSVEEEEESELRPLLHRGG